VKKRKEVGRMSEREDGGRRKEEGRRRKEEGGKRKEEGGRRKEEGEGGRRKERITHNVFERECIRTFYHPKKNIRALHLGP
jgi:hypothetical protein